MSRRDKIYLWIVALIAISYIGYQVYGPQPVDWNPSFSGSDKIPYGAYILENELPALFPESDIQTLTIPTYEYLLRGDTDSARRNWIFINNHINFDPPELKLLMERVRKGDHLFVSAASLGRTLMDSLGISIRHHTAIAQMIEQASRPDQQNESEIVEMNLVNPELRDSSGWTFEEWRSAYFSRVDTATTTILGELENGSANFISMTHGEGTVYIQLFPLAFTNYYLREDHHAEYAFKSLSYLPVRSSIWDEYQKAGREAYTTPMGYILGQPPLRNAWFLTLAGILLFMIFKGRREQRAIPERMPPKNSTLEFAKTIGSLYLEKGTHKEIAEKKIRFFTEFCRRNLGIEITETELSAADAIAARSGISEKRVQKLLDQARDVQQRKQISKEQLKQVTSQIDQFYKDSVR